MTCATITQKVRKKCAPAAPPPRRVGEVSEVSEKGNGMREKESMVSAAEAVVWINNETHEVMIWPQSRGVPGPQWSDPIGAAYTEWGKMTNADRMRLMTETAIDLAMQGYALKDVLAAFAQVDEFRALGSQSYPMARALTSANMVAAKSS
jgi:hypothetical protein